jgi:hypothetical protein
MGGFAEALDAQTFRGLTLAILKNRRRLCLALYFEFLC